MVNLAANGKVCTSLSNYHHGSGSYSGFDFHMYNKDCTEQAYVICENGLYKCNIDLQILHYIGYSHNKESHAQRGGSPQ